MSYPNKLYTAFSFLGFLMCLFPLPCHFKVRNTGTCLYIFWAGTGCLIYCINSIVWNGNAINRAPIWCEICSRFILAASLGIPASSLCICRRLYLVQLGASRNEIKFSKGHFVVVDLILGLCLPLLWIPIFYITQGHSFDILEDVGCLFAIYNTWVAVVSIYLPPLLISLVSASYAIRSFIAINKMRSQFRQLISRNSDMTYSLYFRLMALAGTETLCTTAVTTAYVIINSTLLYPWISWEDTHSDFHRADLILASIWRKRPLVAQRVELTRWLFVVCAILFFIFFGFAEEVRKLYGPPFQYVLKKMGISRSPGQSVGITFRSGGTVSTDTGTQVEKYCSDITSRDCHTTTEHSHSSIHLSPCPSLHSSAAPVPKSDV